MNAFALTRGLPEAPRANISVPQYKRSTITPGIVHIGVGNFHRAHQANYLNQLFNRGRDLDWGVLGAGILPADVAMREALLAQNCLSTVIELDPAGNRATINGAMVDFLPVDPETIVQSLTRAEIRIVSLTITEGGYFIDAMSGGFDAGHPDVMADVADPDHPKTVFGIVLKALRVRRAAGLSPFTILSCDNIPNNGQVTRNTMVEMATLSDGGFGAWIAQEVACPNSMVDCITPTTGPRERALVLDEFAIEDRAPVVCEPFRQWVLEDHFPLGRPTLEEVGVTFVDDVAPYELMKLRVLNGGHAALAYAGALMGCTFAHEAIATPMIRGYLDALTSREVIPTLDPIPGVDFEVYSSAVLERFGNPLIGDTIDRLCQDGSNRQPKFILPTIVDRIASGSSIEGLALEVALWCRYCAGFTENGSAIPIRDPRADKLRDNAQLAETDPAAFVRDEEIFGALSGNVVFQDAFERASRKLRQLGVIETLRSYIANG